MPRRPFLLAAPFTHETRREDVTSQGPGYGRYPRRRLALTVWRCRHEKSRLGLGADRTSMMPARGVIEAEPCPLGYNKKHQVAGWKRNILEAMS